MDVSLKGPAYIYTLIRLELVQNLNSNYVIHLPCDYIWDFLI